MNTGEPKRFKNKEEIKEFLELVANKMGVERDSLADKIGISTSAFYGYITRREIPQKSYKKFSDMLNGNFQDDLKASTVKSTNKSITSLPLDDLVAEIERRGWLVELKRISSTTTK